MFISIGESIPPGSWETSLLMSEGIQTMAQNLQVWGWPFSLLKSQSWVRNCLNVRVVGLNHFFRKFIYLRVVKFSAHFVDGLLEVLEGVSYSYCSVPYYTTVVDFVQSLGIRVPVFAPLALGLKTK
jgi:hypothetical protein